ncbi:MAG: MATE family efflux transporter [Firmicutes bacterium]|nr:MATE family efflux transporter [Bacillota bacterium]
MTLSKKNIRTSFYNKLFFLSIPIIIQNLITASLNMIDTVMIGRLGDEAVAGVGIANQVFFLFMVIAYGVNTGGSVFISQFWGKKDTKNLKKTVSIILILGISISVLFLIGACFLPKTIMKLFIKDINVIKLGSSYLNIIGISYIFTAISLSYGYCLRSIGKTSIPMKISIFSLSINTILNYILIFGFLFIKPLGIKGAAIATLISRIIETLLLINYIYLKDSPLKVSISDIKEKNKELFNRFFKVTLPVIMNEGIWALGNVLFMVIYGLLGTEAVASIQISNTVYNIFSVIMFGVGNASSIIIGEKIGEENNNLAYKYAVKVSILTPLLGGIFGGILYGISEYVITLFNVSSIVKTDAIILMKMIGLFMGVKFFNEIILGGVFRSGGDTKYSLYIDLIGIWFIALPLGFIGAKIFNLPVYIIYLIISFEELLEVGFAIKRLKSKKWLNNVVKGI